MPYVVVDADTKKVIWPMPSSHKEYDAIQLVSSTSALHDGQRKVHTLPPIHIPDNVIRIALHVANDAYHYRRDFQLFPWTVSDAPHSKVHIYELRSDLKRRFIDANNLQTPPDNALVAKPNVTGEYYGCLDGDLWLRISHEFTNGDITRLCPPETLSRNPPASTQAQAGAAQQTAAPGNVEQVQVDWLTTLAPIYAAGEGSRSMAPFTVEIGNLGITLTFIARALANAVYTSDSITVQQALRRTSPRTFAAILKAAWRLHIDKLSLSSSWRPMLGSRLHKMGVGLDVTEIDDSAEHIDFTIHNRSHADRNRPFPTSTGGQKLARIYQELIGDAEVMDGAVYTPWVNWVEPHDTHMHITVKDE